MQSDEAARTVWQRNARLRAWAVHGLLLDAAWSLEGPRYARLRFACRGCGAQLPTRGFFLDHWGTASFEGAEQDNVELLLYRGCTHLQALLGEDPPEVRAIIALELLVSG